MQTYKISTLGQSFIFINRSITDIDSSPPQIRIAESEKAHVVEIKPDMKFDYRISTERAGNFFAPDLFRSVLIFLYAVKGLPKSEYEILFDNDKIPKAFFYDGFGGNVGKCKLLFSKRAENVENCDVVFHLVESPSGNYIFVICDKPDVADMKKITSRALSECTSISSLRGSCALSYSSSVAAVKFYSLDGFDFPDTSAYAASAFLIKELFGIYECEVGIGEFKSRCTADSTGVCVYDLFPSVHKLF